MRSPPHLLVPIAIGAVISAILLRLALYTHLPLLWLLFGLILGALCTIIVLLGISVKHLRFKDFQQLSDGALTAWPRELNVLTSYGSDQVRALAAASLARKINLLPNYPYLSDAVAVLRDIVQRSDTSEILRASALGALSEIDPKDLDYSVWIDTFSSINQNFSYARTAALGAINRRGGSSRILHDCSDLTEEQSCRLATYLLSRSIKTDSAEVRATCIKDLSQVLVISNERSFSAATNELVTSYLQYANDRYGNPSRA